MADHKYIGFFYVEGDKTNGFIDQSMSYTEALANPADKISFMKILGRFDEPVFLTYQKTSEANKDHVDQILKYVLENTDGTRSQIDPHDEASLWPHFFRMVKFIYDYFYQNIKHKPLENIKKEIEEILTGARQDASGIIKYSKNVYQSGTMALIPTEADPEKIGSIKFHTTNVGSTEHRRFTIYINPKDFVLDYTPENPYIHVYYTDDRDISLKDMAEGISQVQSEIAGKVLHHYRRYEGTTVINGKYTTTTFHIWSTRVIPEDDASLLRMKIFREALQNAVRTKEPVSEEELLVKYPEIFTATQRVLYCLSENHTMNNVTVGTSYLLSNPVRLADIENLMISDDALKAFAGEPIEIFTIDANQIWVPIIAAGGLSDKIPFYRPTLAGIKEFQDQAPEEAQYARVFWRTLVRIINNAYDGVDLNSSIAFQIEQGDPIIAKPNGTIKFYSFSYKTVEWHVYCGKRL